MAEVEDRGVLDWRSERFEEAKGSRVKRDRSDEGSRGKLEFQLDFVLIRVSFSILFPKALKQRTKKGTQFITDFIPKGLTTQISIFVLTRPTLSFVLVWSPLLRNQWDEKEERTSTPSNNGPATDQCPILDDKPFVWTV
ncbi:hypothetical protein CDAR_478661 [Caerostris darwini]|uniref:Uncharacterized protein n=1 Tax=Caerostris darwini TaxID=1538125 RepID=A0AAV4QLD3_9ARAC|nr:hypothetical protein CDAR_478661 [Caerostris darwini]